MTPYSSEKEKYNAGYFKWLTGYSKHFFMLPFRESVELIEWAKVTVILLNYVICMLLFPITLPIIIFFVMTIEKRKLVKQHGKNALTEGS